jgi:hypothetical protein
MLAINFVGRHAAWACSPGRRVIQVLAGLAPSTQTVGFLLRTHLLANPARKVI